MDYTFRTLGVMSPGRVETADPDPSDVETIAAFHVERWRVAYCGMLPGALLTAPLVADRLKLWHARRISLTLKFRPFRVSGG